MQTTSLDLGEMFSTYIELLQWRAQYQPDKLAYIFLKDGEVEEQRFTYAQLDQRARCIAALLQTYEVQGEPILLLYPQCLEYMAAFFGCLYAGAIAVPTYPPKNTQNTRIESIVVDAKPRIALISSSLQDKGSLSTLASAHNLAIIATETLEIRLADQWISPSVDQNTIAFLQYTSGSTGNPKGVMVSQGNLLVNHRMLQTVFQHPDNTPYVSWLPLFHDMGLIGNALQAVYRGAPCVFMSPTAFIQKPYRWLKAISDYRAHTSYAPNSAYDLCVQKVTPEQKATLDLSSWRVALNGAEPIRDASCQAFYENFASCGLRPDTLAPGYGLAEATLFVASKVKSHGYSTCRVDAAAFEQGRIVITESSTIPSRIVVGCGNVNAIPDLHITIVDPESRKTCIPGHVGEIWVAGPSVAKGYWNKPKETEETFFASLSGLSGLSETKETRFLRTGDLGFVKDGELYITGRLKDLIIIDGRNHYPQDIEATVEQSHPALRQGACAVFSVSVDEREQLVVVVEVNRQIASAFTRDAIEGSVMVKEIINAIKSAVVEEHDIRTYAVSLLKPGNIAKTSSGKIQRRACREQFLTNNLGELKS